MEADAKRRIWILVLENVLCTIIFHKGFLIFFHTTNLGSFLRPYDHANKNETVLYWKKQHVKTLADWENVGTLPKCFYWTVQEKILTLWVGT